MLILDDALPLPPWTSLLLRFIGLRDTFATLGNVKSLNIVGENTRAAINMETLRGFVYVSDWNLDDNIKPIFKAYGSVDLPPSSDGASYGLERAGDSKMVIEENTDDFYTVTHNPSLNRTEIKPQATGIYKILLNATFQFAGQPIECWCGNNWPIPGNDTAAFGRSVIQVDNGLLGGAGPLSAVGGYAYVMCTEGGFGDFSNSSNSRCVARVSSSPTAGDGMLFSVGYTVPGASYFESSECTVETICTVAWNLSIVQLYQNP